MPWLRQLRERQLGASCRQRHAHLLGAPAQARDQLVPGGVDRDLELLGADHERRDLRMHRAKRNLRGRGPRADRQGGARHGRLEGHRRGDRGRARSRGRARGAQLAQHRALRVGHERRRRRRRRSSTRSRPSSDRSTILVCNTGGPPLGRAVSFTREQWEAAYRSLVLAPVALIERVGAGHARARAGAACLNVASSSVREPIAPLLLSNTHRSATVAGFKTSRARTRRTA